VAGAGSGGALCANAGAPKAVDDKSARMAARYPNDDIRFPLYCFNKVFATAASVKHGAAGV
jgi:hypothetical protein